MYDVYGIVKIEDIVVIKVKILYLWSHIIPSIPPKHAKTREPKDEHCVIAVHVSCAMGDTLCTMFWLFFAVVCSKKKKRKRRGCEVSHLLYYSS